MLDLSSGVEHIAFVVNQQHIQGTHLDLWTSVVSYVTREVCFTNIMRMEIECAGVTLTPSLILFFTLFIWNLEGGGEYDLH
jgi:hypothetical protein